MPSEDSKTISPDDYSAKQSFIKRLMNFGEKPDKEEEDFKEKMDFFLNGEKQSFGKKFKNFFINPNEAQQYGRRAFLGELFSLASQTISPFAAVNRSLLAATFGLQQSNAFVNKVNDNLARASQISIYNRASNSLIKEIKTTMPEVEQDLKADILRHNTDRIVDDLYQSVHFKYREYSSYVGFGAAFIGLATLNWPFLALGVPAYFMGRHVSQKWKDIQKRVFPYEFQSRQKNWQQQNETIQNADLHFSMGDNEEQVAKSDQERKNLAEIVQYRIKKITPTIWGSSLVTTLLTGTTLLWGFYQGSPATDILKMYVATSAFLGSIQSFVMARYMQKEASRSMIRNYNQIKHQKDFDLQLGNEKLPENVDTICVDNDRYHHRTQTGERVEQPVLDFKSKFYFKPGINILGGVSGVGKSTLYKLLRHADDLNGGKISLGNMENGHFTGKELTQISLQDASKNIAFSLPEIRYQNKLTAVHIIKTSNPKLSKDTLQKLANFFNNVTKKDDKKLLLWEDDKRKKEKLFSTMSSGQKKMTLFLSAIVSPKNILVLDEPTSGVDPKAVNVMLDMINQLAKKKTIIFTTHHPEEILKLNVSNIVKLEKKKAADGTVLPTDVTIYPKQNGQFYTDEDKQFYIDSYGINKDKKEKDENQESLLDILENNVVSDEDENPYENVLLKNLLNSDGVKKGVDLHAIVSSKSKLTQAKKILTLQAIKAKARQNPEKYQRINKALNKDSSR